MKGFSQIEVITFESKVIVNREKISPINLKPIALAPRMRMPGIGKNESRKGLSNLKVVRNKSPPKIRKLEPI